jgi:MFS family permease
MHGTRLWNWAITVFVIVYLIGGLVTGAFADRIARAQCEASSLVSMEGRLEMAAFWPCFATTTVRAC